MFALSLWRDCSHHAKKFFPSLPPSRMSRRKSKRFISNCSAKNFRSAAFCPDFCTMRPGSMVQLIGGRGHRLVPIAQRIGTSLWTQGRCSRFRSPGYRGGANRPNVLPPRPPGRERGDGASGTRREGSAVMLAFRRPFRTAAKKRLGKRAASFFLRLGKRA